jgi:organic radical activating enzyme
MNAPDHELRASADVLAFSESFESVQGEGVSAGEPSVFLRLAHCNLRCNWCDTKYTWDFRAYRYEDEVRFERVVDLAARLNAFSTRRLVLTGGEPLLQQAGVAQLFSLLGADFWVEVETNGTRVPEPALVERVDQWNVSPKLAHSGEPENKRIRPEALAAFLATGRAHLKLVVSSPGDAAEAEAIVAGAGWPRERVLWMAEGATRATLAERGPLVRAEALRRGFGYSPRLHVERWDGARGV